jgi:hypothetical protein
MSEIQSKTKEAAWLNSTTGVAGRYYIECFRDTEVGEFVCFSKLDPKISYARIRGKGIIHYYVIKGTLLFGANSFPAGTWVRVQPDVGFIPSTNEDGCEVFCVYTRGYEEETNNGWVFHPPMNRR